MEILIDALVMESPATYSLSASRSCARVKGDQDVKYHQQVWAAKKFLDQHNQSFSMTDTLLNSHIENTLRNPEHFVFFWGHHDSTLSSTTASAAKFHNISHLIFDW